MKISHLIFGSLLLALTACNPSQREAKQLLRQAEGILEIYPDSALQLIDSVMHMEVYFSETQRMEMALLQARAIYGDDRDATDPTKSNGNFLFDKVMNHTYTSPDLDCAPAYFAQKGQPKKAALAAIREQKTLAELSKEFEVSPNQISQWKQEAIRNMEKYNVPQN